MKLKDLNTLVVKPILMQIVTCLQACITDVLFFIYLADIQKRAVNLNTLIFYIFGRYPKARGELEYPLTDLIICHGDFLNADHDYVHKNRHVKGFGTYGDIMIRDRKMYVVPTPFHLVSGSTGVATLIVPEGYDAPSDFVQVGNLTRVESAELVAGYSFDLRSNQINAQTIPNPHAGEQHIFKAYRLSTQPTCLVKLNVAGEK